MFRLCPSIDQQQCFFLSHMLRFRPITSTEFSSAGQSVLSRDLMGRLSLTFYDVFATYLCIFRQQLLIQFEKLMKSVVRLNRLEVFSCFPTFFSVFQCVSELKRGRGVSLSLQRNGCRLADWQSDDQYEVDHRGGWTWWTTRLVLVICYQLGGFFTLNSFTTNRKTTSLLKSQCFQTLMRCRFFLVENILVYESSGAGKCP